MSDGTFCSPISSDSDTATSPTQAQNSIKFPASFSLARSTPKALLTSWWRGYLLPNMPLIGTQPISIWPFGRKACQNAIIWRKPVSVLIAITNHWGCLCIIISAGFLFRAIKWKSGHTPTSKCHGRFELFFFKFRCLEMLFQLMSNGSNTSRKLEAISVSSSFEFLQFLQSILCGKFRIVSCARASLKRKLTTVAFILKQGKCPILSSNESRYRCVLLINCHWVYFELT